MRPDLRSEVSEWLARAAQARRVANMLSNRDADVARAYARECEAKAREVAIYGMVASIAA